MKTNLQKTLFAFVLTIATCQVSNAQYAGTAFGGTIPELGASSVTSTTIEFENYDALANEVNGSGSNNPNDVFPADPLTATGTYYDTDEGTASRNPEVREGSPVSFFTDPAALFGESPDPITVTMVNGQKANEYLLYTVDVKTAGEYSFKMNYRSGAGGRVFKISTVPLDLSTETTLAEVELDGTRNSSNTPVFMESSNDVKFTLTAGVQLIKITWLVQAMGVDNMTFTYTGTLSTDESKLKDNVLSAYPNPALDGQFTLSTKTNWTIYSVLGVKILHGNENKIDLSRFAKGTYILKAGSESKILISK